MFDPAYAYLFNSYYETVGPRHPRPRRGLLSRPSVDEIARYRAYVDRAMHELIDGCDAEAAALVELGLHHEQQHQELLLMDIKHVLSCNPTDPVYTDALYRPAAPTTLRFANVHGGNVEIGHDGPGFSFDNEGPRHVVHLERTSIADRLVSAREWLEFIADDGYRRPELWLSDGWYAVQANGWEAPLYWRDEDNDRWSVFTLGGRRPLDLERARRARQPLRSRRVRRAGATRGCPPSSSGSTRPGAPRRAHCATSTTSPGSGRRARTCRTRAFDPRPVPSANTTGSS